MATSRYSWIRKYLLLIHVARFSACITINYGSEKEFPERWNSSFASQEEEETLFASTISPRSFPFFVLLVEGEEEKEIICGGSLISPRHVLTAGHCASTIEGLLNGEKDVEAWINPYTRRADFDKQIATVIDIERHEDFLPRPYLHNDIAIATLEEPVTLSSKASVICIGVGDYDEHEVALIGFGNYDCFSDSSHLRIAQGSVLNSTKCKARGHGGRLLETHVCATLFDARGRRAEQAQGDSGGPLFFEREGPFEGNKPEGICAFVQIGLVSYNFVIKGKKDLRGDIRNPCPNMNIPGTYTRIGAYKDFIRGIAPEAKFWE